MTKETKLRSLTPPGPLMDGPAIETRKCTDCDGTGAEPDVDDDAKPCVRECATCHGKGAVDHIEVSGEAPNIACALSYPAPSTRPPRTPAEMVAAYRKAALTLHINAADDAAALAASGRAADGAPLTVTGTATAHRCELSNCRATRFPDGSQDWACLVCGEQWSTPPDPESPWWLVLGLAAALFGSLLLFAAGYATAIALRSWGLA